MNKNQIETRLQQYLETEVLENRDIGLSPHTPLLELGLLNSMEISGLLAFVRRELGVTIRPDAVTGPRFHSIESIARTIVECSIRDEATAGEQTR
jgi:medium-chain acyl-[acyl-carrier-protein] hydrolase